MNYQDPEWTEPDGRERGAGAIAWLAVAAAIAIGLAGAAFWIWM